MVENPVVEAARQESAEQVEEIGVGGAAHPQRRVGVVDGFDDFARHFFGGGNRQFHHARDKRGHVLVVFVVGVVGVVFGAATEVGVVHVLE